MSIFVNGLFPGTLEPDTTVAGCIDIFEKVWPNPEKTIELIEKECLKSNNEIYWQRAETRGHGVEQDIRTNQMMAITHLARVNNNGLLQNIHNQFHMILLASSISYSQRYGLQEGLWHEPYSLLKYGVGQEYKRHYDGTSNIGRTISALIYLNDDYQGGELEFPNFGIKIKPQAGMLVLFPSNFAYSHVAHPVVNGTKYALVTWIADREIR
jgi:predicted 2-oxoglutarate/Fe(II)-dependent dioxygenase YbiX